MDDIKSIIIDNYSKYPVSQIQDIAKLLYQNEFGCGHLVKNESGNFDMFLSEWNATYSQSAGELFEPIGNGFLRLNLSAAKALGIPARLVHRLFIVTAKKQVGTNEGFLEKMSVFEQLCALELLPFAKDDIQAFLADWEKNGHPLFSHSREYKEAYAPAYRVVFTRYQALLPVLVDMFSRKDSGAIVAIDGRCGSGKTTLAEELSEIFEANVIHMDDFFLPKELRTPARLAEPGGNIHYERFTEEIADNVKNKRQVSYRIFDCSIMDYGGTVQLKDRPLTIIEGAYSLHPLFEDIYDIKIFCDIDKQKQKERIIKRNGPDGYINFRDRWIPMEEKYFSGMDIMAKCKYIVKMS